MALQTQSHFLYYYFRLSSPQQCQMGFLLTSHPHYLHNLQTINVSQFMFRPCNEISKLCSFNVIGLIFHSLYTCFVKHFYYLQVMRYSGLVLTSCKQNKFYIFGAKFVNQRKGIKNKGNDLIHNKLKINLYLIGFEIERRLLELN